MLLYTGVSAGCGWIYETDGGRQKEHSVMYPVDLLKVRRRALPIGYYNYTQGQNEKGQDLFDAFLALDPYANIESIDGRVIHRLDERCFYDLPN